MSTRVDVEEIQTTNGEKLLSLVLALFLLIGGIWVYVKIGDAVRTTSPPDISYRGTPAEQAAVDELRSAQGQLSRAQVAAANARDNLELRREAYRTALEAHRAEATRLGVAYDSARKRYAQARQNVVEAKTDVALAQPAANSAERHIAQVQVRPSPQARAARFRPPARLGAREPALRVLAARPAEKAGLPLLPGRDRVRRIRGRPRVRDGDGLPDGLLRPARPRAIRALDRRDRAHAARLRRTAAIPRQTASGTPRSEARVPVLRLPGSRQHTLRGVRP